MRGSVEGEPELAKFLERVIVSPVFEAEELPQPSDEEKKPPRKETEAVQNDLGLS